MVSRSGFSGSTAHRSADWYTRGGFGGASGRRRAAPVPTEGSPTWAIERSRSSGHDISMEITINLDDDLLREATAAHPGKSTTAVLELGLCELINADQRKTLAAAFGSQPALQSAPASAWQ